MERKLMVLVAEDELLERKAIVELIRLCHESVEISEADNGQRAVEAAAVFPLDIAFMDISMPVINGLDALRKMYQYQPGLFAVVLTAYDEFEYAVDALKLGVEDYILKPARKNKIDSCIAEYLRRSQGQAIIHSPGDLKGIAALFPYLEDNLLLGIAMGNVEETRQLLRYFFADSSRYVLAVAPCDERAVLQETLAGLKATADEQGITLIGGKLGKWQMVLCAGGEDDNGFAQQIKVLLPRESEWRISPPLNDWRMLNTQYRLLTGSNPIGVCEAVSQQLPDGCERLIATQVAAADEEEALQTLAVIFETLRAEEIAIQRQKLFSLCIIVDHYLEKMTGISFSDSIPDFSLLETADALYNAMRFFVKARISVCHQGHQPKILKLIRDVINDIERHYPDGMYSLNAASQNLGLSPGYLSKLFKMRMGITFTEYLSEVRIDEAKRLLRHSDLEIAEISNCCGFNSANYFCKIFKKIVGLPASDYREEH